MKVQQHLPKMIITAAILGGLMILQGCSGEQEAAPKAPAKTASAPAASTGTTDTSASTASAAPAEAASSAIDGEALYTACAACHAAGVANAPILGNTAQWAPRIANGIDALTASAIKGKGAMPPKGGRMDYNDEQIKAIVEYMVNASK